MNDSIDKNKSKEILEKVEQALEENDIETVCYMVSMGLTEQLNNEDSLHLIHHKVNLFEKIFEGLLSIKEYYYLIESLSDYFEFFEKFSADHVRKRIIEAYFEVSLLSS